jgi:DNA polymerase III gamma/tau subunit
VVILNECHKATNEFQNSMLEILEEPPKKVYFILCTTEPERLLKTVRNRATTYHVAPLRKPDMINLIDWVLRSEKIELTQKVIDATMFASDGSPRVVLKILDQIINLTEEEKQLETISEVSVDETLVIDLCRAIASNDSGAKRWQTLTVLLKGFDADAEGARRAILGYLSAILLNSKDAHGKHIALLMAEFANNYYDIGKPGLVMSCYMSTLI